MKKVSNPLTIVAIFASIADIAGTTVLPFVRLELQNIFIYYVMLFPILIVILFFLTWNFNSKVLYSPNDFSDESNYMESLKIFYNIKQTVEKGQAEGENEKEIINKVYKSVSNEIEKLGDVENEIIELLSENPNGMTLGEISNAIEKSRSMVRKRIILLQDMEIIDKFPSKNRNINGKERMFYTYVLAKSA